ncbi:MAG: hypothetical protein ACREK4_07985, partial [Candidatus Rokuibacteriota bacterium]
RPRGFPYTVLFAPSWLYRSHPENGSDFANQRRILDTLGVANRLIASGESDSVEDNAAVIVRTIRETACGAGPIVLVSASKSGAEAAMALSDLTSEDAACVAAWINIAGSLRGTPLADSALRGPVKWLARGVFWLSGWSWDALESLETERSRRRLETLRMPQTITVLNVVAVPVSGSVGFQVYPGYQVLSSYGPNDGVVLLADTVWPGGINVVALGADHIFARWRGDAYILAMLRALDLAIRTHTPTPDPTITAEHTPPLTPPQPRRERHHRGGAGMGASEGAWDPFPSSGGGRSAPGWSPAALGQRTRAAWSQGPSLAPIPAPPR